MRKWGKARSVIFCSAAAALAWGLSVAGATEPETYYLLFLLCVPVTLLAVFLAAPDQQSDTRRWLPVWGVGALLFLNIILRPPLLARGYIILSLGWMAFVLTALLIGQDWRKARWLAALLAVMGCVEALYGLAQTVTGSGSSGPAGFARMATGTFIGHNHYAGFLNMTLPFGLGMGLYCLSYKWRRSEARSELYYKAWTILLIASIIGLPVVLSVSRAGIVVFVVCVTVTFLLLFQKNRDHRRDAPGRAVLLAVALVVVIALASGLALDQVVTRFSQLGSDSSFRLAIYRDTTPLLVRNLWTGVGPGMYAWYFRPLQTISEDVLVEHAHNDYLETATEWGLPVAVIFWALVIWLWYRSLKLFQKTRRPWVQAITLGCLFSILSVLLHSLADYNLQVPANLMTFCSVLALSWSLGRKGPADQRSREGACP